MRKAFLWSSVCILLVIISPSLFGQTLSKDSVDVSLLNREAGATTLLTATFVLSDTLRPDGAIELTFPPGFDVSNVKIAGSSRINGGFRVQVQGQTVRLLRQGRGRTLPPGEKVDVKIATVVNPKTAATPQSLKLRVSGSGRSTYELRGGVVISRKKAVGGHEQ